MEIEDIPEVLNHSDRELADRIVLGTYGWPGRSVGVVAEELAQATHILLAIWQQQWPSVRARSVFRTRQRLGEQPTAGVEVARRTSRGPEVGERVVIGNEADWPKRAPSWVSSLVQDLANPEYGLAEFLRRYGPEAPQEGSDIPALARIYEAARNERDPEGSIADLTSVYPDPSEMANLKKVLLDPSLSIWKVDEYTRLRLAVMFAQSVPWQDLDIPGRTRSLIEVDPAQAGEVLLLADQEPKVEEAILVAVATGLNAELVALLASREPEIAARALSVNPEPLGGVSLWELDGTWKKSLLGALGEHSVIVPAHPFLDVAEDSLVNWAIRVEAIPLPIAIDALAANADDSSLDRWWDAFSGLGRQVQRELLDAANSRWEPVALAVASSRSSCEGLVERYAAELAARFDEMGGVVRLRVASAIFALGGKGVVDHWATARSFAALHKAAPKELRAANVADRLAFLDEREKTRPPLREQLVRIVVAEDWSEDDIALALYDAGPGARKVKELTPKKSELRKAFNAAWKTVAKGADMLDQAIKRLGR
ncbi:MAG TPA: hypothetical protein VMS60_07775 [Solirubrobacterales bacterium]|nr:hypothetical protein [Solirubrobacterales bacterium]